MWSVTTERLAAIDMVFFDFDGVFTDNTVLVSQDGVESVRCWRSDGLGLKRLTSVGVRSMIVSTETNSVVGARARKLGMDYVQGVPDKAAAILDLCMQKGIDAARAMFVGNDINDIPAFKVVGLPIAVADAYEEVLKHVLSQTERPGGYGAVREICDYIVRARGGV